MSVHDSSSIVISLTMKIFQFRDKIVYHDSHMTGRCFMPHVSMWTCLTFTLFVHLFTQSIFKNIFIFLIYAHHIFTENSPQIDFLYHPKPHTTFIFPFQTFLLDHHVFVQNWLLVLTFLFSVKYMINLTFETFHNWIASCFSPSLHGIYNPNTRQSQIVLS